MQIVNHTLNKRAPGFWSECKDSSVFIPKGIAVGMPSIPNSICSDPSQVIIILSMKVLAGQGILPLLPFCLHNAVLEDTIRNEGVCEAPEPWNPCCLWASVSL